MIFTEEGFPGRPRGHPEILTRTHTQYAGPKVGTGVRWTHNLYILGAHGHISYLLGLHADPSCLAVYVSRLLYYIHVSAHRHFIQYVSAHRHFIHHGPYYTIPIFDYDYTSYIYQSGK